MPEWPTYIFHVIKPAHSTKAVIPHLFWVATLAYTSFHPDSPSLPLLAQLGLCTEENQQTTAENKVKEAIFNAERFSNLDCCMDPQRLVPTQLQVRQDVDVGVGIWGWGTLQLALLPPKPPGLRGTLKPDQTSM